jgi:hypothetical protein
MFVLTRFAKFGQPKHKFWGYEYKDLCYNTHDIRARPVLHTSIIYSDVMIDDDRMLLL